MKILIVINPQNYFKNDNLRYNTVVKNINETINTYDFLNGKIILTLRQNIIELYNELAEKEYRPIYCIPGSDDEKLNQDIILPYNKKIKDFQYIGNREMCICDIDTITTFTTNKAHYSFLMFDCLSQIYYTIKEPNMQPFSIELIGFDNTGALTATAIMLRNVFPNAVVKVNLNAVYPKTDYLANVLRDNCVDILL